MYRRWAVLIPGAFALALSGCGGGGGGSGATPPGSSGSAQGIAHFTISDPYSTQSHPRRPGYFSDATANLLITINGQSVTLPLTGPQCAQGTTVSCSVDVPASDGSATYTVAARDVNNVTLSIASGQATISGTTTIPLSLDPVWKYAVTRLGNEYPTMGSPSVIPVTISAYDSDNALIVGPEPFSSPLPLFDTDTSGATQLSPSSITVPGATATLSYDGKSYVNASISAGVPFSQTGGEGDTMIPAANIVEYPIPSGAKTWEANLNGKIFSNPDGTLSFAERSLTNAPVIGTLTTSGSITEQPANPPFDDIALGPDNNIWGVTNNAQLAQYTGAGAGFVSPAFSQFSLGPMTLGPDGKFFMTSGGPPTPFIERVSTAGATVNFALPSSVDLAYGAGVVGSDGRLWFATLTGAEFSGLISLTTNGQMTSYPLSVSQIGCCPIRGNLVSAPDGQIYFLYSSTQLGRMTTSGAFSSLTIGMVTPTGIGGEQSQNPIVVGPDRAIWIADGPHASPCDPFMERVTTSGAYAYVELPVSCNSLNGPADQVSAMTVGPDGNLWYTRGAYVGKLIP